MTDRQSGIESWNFITTLERKSNDIEGTLPLALAVICSLGVAPFAILRLMHGEYAIALLDVLIICGMLLLGGWVYRTQKYPYRVRPPVAAVRARRIAPQCMRAARSRCSGPIPP